MHAYYTDFEMIRNSSEQIPTRNLFCQVKFKFLISKNFVNRVYLWILKRKSILINILLSSFVTINLPTIFYLHEFVRIITTESVIVSH